MCDFDKLNYFSVCMEEILIYQRNDFIEYKLINNKKINVLVHIIMKAISNR